MKKILYLLLFMAGSTTVQAQDAEMADVMRSNGKIYVIVAIVLIVLSGLILYLFLLDKKIGKLEKQLNEKK